MSDSFLDALQQTSAQKPGFRCGVQRVRADMTEAHRQGFDAELDAMFRAREDGTTYRHSCESLARLLSDHGYAIRGAVIQGHLAGRCACGR
jgi:hypothetical protein